ncbi:MAG: DUF305 domain-containing protein [Actinomycetota bacterium]|nr:DUF305 domain-containing protein [Actinomycetota bacterium]
MGLRLCLPTALVAAALLTGCGSEEKAGSPAAKGNATERAFLEAMVPHHEAALDMSEVAARRARAPEIKRLAKDIAASQRPEIEQMRRIHQRLFDRPLEADEAAHERLGLSAEEAGMDHGDAAAALARARPFDRAFVDAMVPHHEGAVRMAKVVLAKTRDAELRRLAEGIVATQEREITAMNAFREREYGAPVPGGAHTGGEAHGRGGGGAEGRGGEHPGGEDPGGTSDGKHDPGGGHREGGASEPRRTDGGVEAGVD